SWTLRATAADNAWAASCWVPDAEISVVVGQSGTGTRVMRSYSAVALGAGSNDDLLDRQWTPADGVPAYLRLIVQQAKYNHEAAPINVLDLATSYTQRSGILGGTRGVDEIWADATASGIAQGRGLYLPGRKLYQTSANAILDNPGLGIRGEGMTIKKNGYGPLFRAASASDPAMTGGRLTVSPTKGSDTITLAPADAALLVANQVYVVTDRTLIFAATSTGSYRAEFIMPQDVNATTGVIKLWWPLKYDYLAGAVGNGYARVVTPPFVDNVSYQDFNVLMDPTQDTSVHPDCNAFQNRWLRRHRFRNICVDNFVNAVVTDVACIAGLARDMWFNFGGSATTGTGDPTSTEGRPGFGYGYVQSGLNKGLRGHNLNGFSLRHVVDAGSLAHGDGSTVDYGEPLGTYYSACVHRGALNAAFGSHEAGQDFTLDGCIAEDFHFVGFQLRGRNMRVINCQAINGIGAAIWDRGGDSGNGYAKDTRVTNFKAKNTNQGTSFDGVDWTQWGAIMAEAHGSIYDDIEIEGCGGSAIMVGRNAGFQDQQFRNIKAIDICQKITTGTKAVINVVGGSTTGQMIIDGVESKSSDAKVVDLVNINSGVGAATIKVRRVHGNGHTGSKINNQSASAIVDYNRDTGQRIGREGVTGQYYDLVSDSAAHKLQTFSAVASAKPLQISVNTDASNTAPSGGSLGFDVYINGVRGIGCDTTGQVLQGGSVIFDANRLGIDRSFTVATLPTTASSGARAFASNGRAFNGAGVQEGSGAGTGVSVTRVSTAWKIAGTNVTVAA
ncbi:hypothetical protein, partial [Asticcacaulis taihuensis]|uniref:hypothetical protein n=1 Tax=Asticcacaulis taihuensis TaxID=260084 RepID=UPI003F68DA05